MKQIQVVIPFDKTENVMKHLQEATSIKNVIKVSSDNAHILQFRVSDDRVIPIMERLKTSGVGIEFGYIDVMELSASLPIEHPEEEKKQKISREAILAVEEIHQEVEKSSLISFDFIAFVSLAALVAGVGLIQDNSTYIVASMVLSPLMGPMLGVALGYIIRERDLFIQGTKAELIALLISFLMGSLLAFLLPFDIFNPYSPEPFMSVVEYHWRMEPTFLTEITRRGNIFTAMDVGIAIFSGAAVAISLTRGDMSTLVGVAITAALMPPAVNVGLMFTLGIVTNTAVGFEIAFGSLMQLVMNIIMIDIAAIVMFRIKKLKAISEKSATWKAVTEFKGTYPNRLYHFTLAQGTKEKETASAAEFRPSSDNE